MDRDIEVDAIDEPSWNNLITRFSDANIYQTWPYGTVRNGETNLGHLVVRDQTGVVAAAQARIVRIPYVKFEVAYVLWGPLSRGAASRHLVEFRSAIRALRAEYVDRRGLSLRIVPRIYGEANDSVRPILEQEGYTRRPAMRGMSTIVVDLRPHLDDIHRGLHHKWRYHLNKARKGGLVAVDGEDEDSFLQFERIYAEMVRRKRIVNSPEVAQLKRIQQRLPPELKMRIFLCRAEGEVCAGGVCSSLGDTAIYLFGATSDRGIKTYASYIVHWNMLAWAKSRGCQSYDLNGIDPVRNAGGYQFKSQLAAGHGREVEFLGVYDAYPNTAMRSLMAVADSARSQARKARQAITRFATFSR